MEQKKKFIINVVFYSFIAILGWGILKYVFPVMLPFIIAFLFASMMQMPVRRLCKKDGKWKMFFSVLVCVLFFAIIFLILFAVGMKMLNSVSGLIGFVPSFYQQQVVPLIADILDNIETALVRSGFTMVEDMDSIFQEYVYSLGNYLTEFSMWAVKAIPGSIVSIPGFILKLVITVVSTFFFVIDYDKVLSFIWKCIPEGKKDFARHVKGYFKNTVIVFLKSYTLLFLLTFVELSIGFKIIGIPYAPAVGLVIAIFDIMPVLGTGGIVLPWAVILFVMNEIPMGIGMLVLYLVITVVRNTIEPKLVGTQIGLHPLATLISMYVGLKLLGIFGLFLFPVTLAVLLGMNGNIFFSNAKKNMEE